MPGIDIQKENNSAIFVCAIIAIEKKIPVLVVKNVFQDGAREEYADIQDQEIWDELLHSPDAARRQEWMETVERLDFIKSSRKT